MWTIKKKKSLPDKKIVLYSGMGLAVLAAFVWSGNFIVARAVHEQFPPIQLAFYRWLTATIIIAPLSINKFKKELAFTLKSTNYIFWVALTGITLFNTFIYIAGHYSPAINLALIGTTSSPVMATILATIFLKEAISPLRVTGLIICIGGIILLLSKGNWDTLMNFRFSRGDAWVLLAALMFAIYSTLVKIKPAAISPINFLFTIFCTGTLLLFPLYVWEFFHSPAIKWNSNLLLVILYLGAGTSVIAYLCWNAAIAKLGASRTVLFGNLIPLFSTLEAVIILGEQIMPIHIISGVMVISGLIIANLQKRAN